LSLTFPGCCCSAVISIEQAFIDISKGKFIYRFPSAKIQYWTSLESDRISYELVQDYFGHTELLYKCTSSLKNIIGFCVILELSM
jgi:hypothetical protein